MYMSEEKRPSRPEIFFLPPLKMALSFFDREAKNHAAQRNEEKESNEKIVTKLIEKLSEKEAKD